MKTAGLIEITLLRTLLRLDPTTGRLYWLPRGEDMFRDWGGEHPHAHAARWNGQYAGREALAADHKGYRRGRILGRCYYAHHVVFALTHGRWPASLDHDNRDRSDNRAANLVERSQSQNMKNQALRQNNTSGVSGVNWNARMSRWIARINNKMDRLYLGQFESFEDAVAARLEAEKRYGYHPAHGNQRAA